MSIKPRMIETWQEYISDPKHWELLENRVVYMYSTRYGQAQVVIPRDIVRHLKLKHKDKIDIAIRRKET
jgi:hypothetical protein